ncbi:MAG TPA: PilW family protein [Burkholderiales bacterium]|nr:PilW family protein [Burkholderiales bacterium]
MNATRLRQTREAGFSLTELMVAMVIGLIASLVIQQMFTIFAASSRTATSVADAQENGLFALVSIERDVRIAGYGLASDALLNCSTTHAYKRDPSMAGLAGPLQNFTLRGFSITDGGANSDTLLLQYGTSVRADVDAEITKDMADSSSELTVSNTAGFNVKDLIVAAQNGNCTLMQVTEIETATYKIQHDHQASEVTYNPPAAYQVSPPAPDTPWPAYLPGAKLYNLGDLVSRRYTIGNNSLRVEENGGAPTEMVRDIVTIQAQYGVTADPASKSVTQWVDPIGAWANPSINDYKRIKAIRVAVVARANRRELTPVSPATIKLWPDAAAGQSTVGPTYTVPDRNYRYKVYETIAPLRNAIWGSP